MIRSYTYDVEVLKNFFSISIIEVNDYLKVFKDCYDENDKKKVPIPLVQKYTVKEIKEKLSSVVKYSFYITDKDDSQLLTMLGFINGLRPHYEIQKENDVEKQVPVRTDMFGFNSSKYDRLMVAAFLMFSNQTNNTKELITKLYETSKKIISSQNDYEIFKHDYLLDTLSKYKLPYTDVDLMTVFALNKVGKGVDKNGKTVYFPKSLKQTSINLQWYELLEYELPPISDKDKHFYEKDNTLKGINVENLNKLVEKWDRYIIDEWIEPTMYYNMNDSFILCEMIRLYIDEIRLRYSISSAYGVDVLSSSRSNIADKLFTKFYSEFSGLTPNQWQGNKTERTAMAFKKVIFPFIKFKTKECQELLEEMKKVVVYSTSKKALKEVSNKYPEFKYLKTNNDTGWFEITINKLVYSIATGGLHSQDIPRELKSKLIYIDSPSTGNLTLSDCKEGGCKDKDVPSIWDIITDDSYIYIHFDISSFYPSIMSVYHIAPAHLNEGVFTKLVSWLKDTRIAAKHSEEDLIDGIPKDILAQALKIVINSIYGKLGFESGSLYDRLAVLKVTINGQLMILMLCEELELAGIEVISANTDGIVVKLYKKDKDKFESISNNWKQLTKLDADAEEYKCYINRDINSYVVEELNSKTTYKGALHPKMYAIDLSKGYDMPVVAQAVVNYFLYNKPVLETLYECTNILDFCKSQNVGRQFHVEFDDGVTCTELQRNVRFYVSNQGGSVKKVNNNTLIKSNLCVGYKVTVLNSLDDKRIEYRNINYNYYFKEALKIIDPIKLGISTKQKGDVKAKLKSGKMLIKKHSGMYNSLFDDNED